jgi:hypothetical protein
MNLTRSSLQASTFVALVATAPLAGCIGAVPEEDEATDVDIAALSEPSALVRRGANKCLDVAARGVADGTKIQQWTCNETPAQSFALDDRGNNEFRIINTNSGKCLDVTGNGTSDGTQIQLWPCHEGGAQRFRLQGVGGEYVQLMNPQSGKCLDVSGNSSADGAKVQIWTCNGSDAQAWDVIALGDDGGDGDGDAGDADIYDPFTSLARWSQFVRSPGGSLSIGSHGQSDDGSVASLSIPGRPDLGANDWASPGSASELVFNEQFLYGKFETRVRFASCAAHEEVVNGIFTYFRGGDENENGITDNSEIDIELLCGTPNILWLTTYTDFDDFAPGRLRKLSKKIDMRTGAYEIYTDWPPASTGSGTVPGLALPGFPDPNQFYTVGFEWRAHSVRYYIRLNGKEVDLFVINDASRIPRRRSSFLMNIWHANSHWTNGAAADYPSNQSTMQVDWAKIWR